MSENQPSSPGARPGGDWRAERRREREERRRLRHEQHGWGGPWIGGLILVLVGVIFLLQNFGMKLPDNWWTVFILIPAAASLAAAWRAYEASGVANGAVFAPLIAGLILLAVFLALFFGLNWGMFWPVILIVVGLGVLARAYWPR